MVSLLTQWKPSYKHGAAMQAMPLLILVVGFVIGIGSTVWFYSHGGRIIVYGKEWGPPHVASTDAPASNNDTVSVTWPKW